MAHLEIKGLKEIGMSKQNKNGIRKTWLYYVLTTIVTEHSIDECRSKMIALGINGTNELKTETDESNKDFRHINLNYILDLIKRDCLNTKKANKLDIVVYI